jgi:acetylornithine deacetylase
LALTWPAEVELLRDLVATPSVSGAEEEVGRLVEQTVREWGLDVGRDDAGVRVVVEGARPGPTLAFVSHLDVVPPGAGWTRDPFRPSIEEGRLYGRGSGDAKASVAAMLFAAWDASARGALDSGRLVVVLGYGEETRHTSMPVALERVGTVDAAVVGEPTNLDFAVAQRGLMMVDLVARGDQRHAGYAAEDGTFASSVGTGVSRNVTPPVARAVLDIRSTPAWSHGEIAEVMRSRLASEVVVTSDRLVPCETPAGSRILATASAIRPDSRHYGSPTCSDWVFLRHADAFKCGPGTSQRSHTADEHVDLHEVTAARLFYARLAREYLR